MIGRLKPFSSGPTLVRRKHNLWRTAFFSIMQSGLLAKISSKGISRCFNPISDRSLMISRAFCTVFCQNFNGIYHSISILFVQLFFKRLIRPFSSLLLSSGQPAEVSPAQAAVAGKERGVATLGSYIRSSDRALSSAFAKHRLQLHWNNGCYGTRGQRDFQKHRGGVHSWLPTRKPPDHWGTSDSGGSVG